MRLGLLLHRRWPPYDKWLGSVFAALPDARPLVGAVDQYVDSVDVLTHPDRARRVAAVVAG